MYVFIYFNAATEPFFSAVPTQSLHQPVIRLFIKLRCQCPKRLHITSTISQYFNLRFAPRTIQQRLNGGPTHKLITAVTHHMYQRLDGL